MVSSSKILTVSYGTFSCTAEGFDDPLQAVKETTQFFRGVVNEDRFFGAEPPQVDSDLATEMMRERLSSDLGEGRVTLGTGLGAAALGAGAAAVSTGAITAALSSDQAATFDEDEPADLLPDDDTIEATAVLTERVVEPAFSDAALLDADIDTAADPDSTPAPAALTPSPDIAAKLDRIRAVVADDAKDDAPEAKSTSEAKPSSEDSIPADPKGLEQEAQADDAASNTLKVAKQRNQKHVQDKTPEPAAETSDAPEISDDNDILANVAANVTAKADTAEDLPEAGDTSAKDPVEAVTADTPDAAQASVADAIVDAFEFKTDAEPSEDQPQDEAKAPQEQTPALARKAEPEGDTSQSEDLIRANLANAFEDALHDTDSETAQAPQEQHDTDDLEELDDDALDALLNELQTPDAAPEPQAPIAETAPQDAGLDDTLADLVSATPAEPEPVQAPKAPAPAAQPVRQARARVVKVKRAQFQKAIEAGQVEEIEEIPAPAQAPAASGSSLSAEDEADLAAELAAVKAELDGTDVPPAPKPVSKPAPAAQAPASPTPKAPKPVAQEPAAQSPEAIAAAAAQAVAQSVAPTMPEEKPAQPASEPLRLDNPVTPAAQDSVLDPDMDSAVEDLVRDSARKAVKMASPARAMLTETSVEDGDTSRLLDQTNSEMDEPEGNRRRTAIQHLRAAVAATKAERLLGKKDSDDDQMEPYREDLATVVRPRRPQPGTARTERPKEADRPAPLKLVAEQRVEDMTTAPVRPRRVQRRPAEVPTQPAPAAEAAPQPAVQPAPKSEAPMGGFAAYAAEMGAHEMPELLEAAAAYMSFVEGRPQFSRPQLMTIVREAELEESSREDRLRNFGQLLREGKIEKTAGGRFTASQRISFRP